MDLAYNTNGNKVLKLTYKDLLTDNKGKVLSVPEQCPIRGFSIQTLNNLPSTDRKGVNYYTKNEVYSYLKDFGTSLQKKAVGAHFKEVTLRNIINGSCKGSPLWLSLEGVNLGSLSHDILGYGCKYVTKVKLQANLLDLSSYISWCDRLVYNVANDSWRYIAGQSYTEEIASIRKDLLK